MAPISLNQIRCAECKRIFCCVNCRLKHEENAHGNIACPLCSGKPFWLLKEYKTSEWLIRHVEAVHLPMHCVKCQKVFMDVNDLTGSHICHLAKSQFTPLTPGEPSHIRPSLPIKDEFKELSLDSSIRTNTPASFGCSSENMFRRNISGNPSLNRGSRSLYKRLLTTSTPMTSAANKCFSSVDSQVSDIKNQDNDVAATPKCKIDDPYMPSLASNKVSGVTPNQTPIIEYTTKEVDILSDHTPSFGTNIISKYTVPSRNGVMKRKSLCTPVAEIQENPSIDTAVVKGISTDRVKHRVRFAGDVYDNDDRASSEKLSFTPKNHYKNSTRFETIRMHFENDDSKNVLVVKTENDENNKEENISTYIRTFARNNSSQYSTRKFETSKYDEEISIKSPYVDELYITANNTNNMSCNDLWYTPHSTMNHLVALDTPDGPEKRQCDDDPEVSEASVSTLDSNAETTIAVSIRSDVSKYSSTGIWSSVACAMRSVFHGIPGISTSKKLVSNEIPPNLKCNQISIHAAYIANMLLRRSSGTKRRRSTSNRALDIVGAEQSPIAKRVRGQRIRGREPIARMKTDNEENT